MIASLGPVGLTTMTLALGVGVVLALATISKLADVAIQHY